MEFLNQYLGEFAAIATAVCWAGNAMFFEIAGKKVGSLSVNFIRLFFGLLFISIFTLITRGMILPFDADGHIWFWLFMSGIVGVVLGDLFLFEAFVVLGARISMLIMSLVPPFTAIMGWLFLGEEMTVIEIVGMIVTITGISMVILERDTDKKQVKLSHPVLGVLFALGGALGQSAGLILSKYGVGQYNAFAATQIRLMAGVVGFAIIFTFMNRWGKLFSAFRDRKAVVEISAGSFLGPFLGISLSLIAVQRAKVGIASTLIAISPLIIIPLSIIFRQEKVSWKEAAGAAVAIAGVAIFFI
jgi:drug/metabolite transporter (DMT)-like permease